MKLVILFKGGLGNQIFQYGMYTWQKYVNHQDVCYYYSDYDHNGFELDKYFDVSLKKAPVFYSWLYWLVWRLNKYGICKKYMYFQDGRAQRKSDIFVWGYWVDKQYFLHEGFDISYKQLPLSERNKRIVELMREGESVAIHVRRGDYLLPQNQKRFTMLGADYYSQAIALCREKLGTSVRFFFFSDDIAWVKENIQVENAEYIDWNTGKESIYDMYLMSQASANIIANSTFSYWAAFLNKRNRLVVYPKNWFANGWIPGDIFPDDWVVL